MSTPTCFSSALPTDNAGVAPSAAPGTSGSSDDIGVGLSLAWSVNSQGQISALEELFRERADAAVIFTTALTTSLGEEHETSTSDVIVPSVVSINYKRGRASPTTPQSASQVAPRHRSSSHLSVGNDDEEWDDFPQHQQSQMVPTDRREVSPCRLATLPLATIANMLMFLDACEIATKIVRLNSIWKSVCRSRMVWRMLSYREYPVMSSEVESFCQCAANRCLYGDYTNHRDMEELHEMSAMCPLLQCLMDFSVVECTGCGAMTSKFDVARAVRWEDAYHNLPYLARIMVCDQRNNRLKRMRLDGTSLGVMDEDSGVEIATPSGITALPTNGEIAITEFGLNSVSIINCCDNTVVRRFQVGYLPRGIATLPDGNLIICIFGLGIVRVFTPRGEAICVVPIQFRGPSGITILPDNRVAISDCVANRVVIITMAPVVGARGNEVPYAVEVLHVFCSAGYSELHEMVEDLEEPRGLAFNPKDGTLLVCESNRLLVLCPNTGEVLHRFEDSFECLAAVAVLPDGRHAVVSDCDHHRVLVVRLDDGRVIQTLGSPDEDDFHFPRCLIVLPGIVCSAQLTAEPHAPPPRAAP